MQKGLFMVVLVLGFVGGMIVLAASADQIARRPIIIDSNYDFTAKNGVVSGSGTVDDPYIIEGWKIDAGDSDYGIRIHRTDRAFIIRNVEISGAAKAAISLSYVKNATIENCKLNGNWIGITADFSSFSRISRCTIENNTDGIHLYFAHDNQILQNSLAENDTAIWLDAADDNEVIGNALSQSHMGAYLDLGSQGNVFYRNSFLDNVHNAHSVSANQWDKNGEGNYWSDFRAIDADGDGIWDSSYVIRSDGDKDNFPLVAHPARSLSSKGK